MALNSLLKSIEKKSPLLKLNEEFFRDVVSENSILIAPITYENNACFTEYQDRLLRAAGLRNMQGIRPLIEEKNYQVQSLNSETVVIDLGIIVLCNPDATQILVSILARMFRVAIEAGAEFKLKFFGNCRLNKIGELRWEDKNKNVTLRSMEMSDKTLAKLIDGLSKENDDKNKTI